MSEYGNGITMMEGFALDRERIPDYPYGESFDEYRKARAAEEERDLKRADYPFDDDPADWTARIGGEE